MRVHLFPLAIVTKFQLLLRVVFGPHFCPLRYLLILIALVTDRLLLQMSLLYHGYFYYFPQLHIACIILSE